MNSMQIENKSKNKLVPYNKHEIDNFKNGKVLIVRKSEDVIEFINNISNIKINAKLYFGKISKDINKKINDYISVNLDNYNISLQNHVVIHILNHHSHEKEKLRGQTPIILSDFTLIPEIITNFDKVRKTGFSKQGKLSITFEKNMENIYILIVYISDKNHNLEIKTMYKKKQKKSSSHVFNADIP